MASAKSRTEAQIVLVEQAGLGGGRAPVDNSVGNLLRARRIAADGKHHAIKIVGRSSVDIELGGFRNHFYLSVAARKTHPETPRVEGPEARQAIRRGIVLAGVSPLDPQYGALERSRSQIGGA